MAIQPHRIRRQRWLLRAGSGVDALAMRQRMRAGLEGLVTDAFERAFDQVSQGDRLIRISKLELHLKVPSEDLIPGQLPELIHAQLVEQFRDLRINVSGRDEGSVADGEFREGNLPGQNLPRQAPNKAWRSTLSRQERFEWLLHFLQTGSMRWDAGHLDANAFAAELNDICRESALELRDLTLRGPGTEAFFFRLFQVMAPASAAATARAILDRVPQPWKGPLGDLLAVLLESGELRFGRHIQLELVSRFLVAAVAASDSRVPPDLEAILDRIEGNRCVTMDELAGFVPGATGLLPVGSVDRINGHRSLIEERVTAHPATESREGVCLGISEMAVLPPRGRRPSHNRDDSGAFPLRVGAAGLVLLHPFLPRFFETLKVKESGHPGLSSLPRGAALLHFLATGREEIFEYELPFIKVLLGLRADSSLCVAEGLITPADREEADALLRASITHWPVLKNTSPDGFRESFLNRQGLLRESDDGWRLHVERAGYDVLLDQIPWGFGVVKLPWMKRLLHTEW